MRILQVFGSGTIGTDRSGPVSTIVTHLANGYAAAGNDVEVADAPATAPRTLLRPGIAVSEFEPRGGLWNRVAARSALLTLVTSHLAAWSRARFVRALAAERSIDAIHVHDSADAIAISLACDTPVLLTAHNLNWTLEAHTRFTPAAWLGRQLDRLACALVAQVVVLNRQTRRALSNGNVSLIPNGADLACSPAIDRSAARSRLGIPRDEYRVTYLGRIAPEKGTDVFVRAVARARREIPVAADAIGSLSGKFGVSTTVTRYAAAVRDGADSIDFRGFIDRNCTEFRLRLAAADAVVVPSLSEPFGLAVLDALACGSWVIGSDTGGITDTLATRTGDLVPPGDVDALARAIVAHAQRAPDAGRARLARARAQEFRWPDIAQRYLAVMGEMVAAYGATDLGARLAPRSASAAAQRSPNRAARNAFDG